jgi:2,4-dichlorophenol 6-monooxygenase
MASHGQEGFVKTSVLIIGGGACGLSLSIFLSDHGINHFLFEKHPRTSILPKAHYINQRTMEIFRQHGVVEAIRAPGCPIRNMGKVDWRTSLGGEEPWEGKVLGFVPSFGGLPGTPDYEAYRSHSAELSCNLPLSRSEPVLRRIAEERNPEKVLFNHRVIDFAQDSDGVVATIEDPSGKHTKYRAQYLVGADGGKTVGPKLGIEMEGPKNLVDYVSAHFKADLSQYWDGTCFQLTMIDMISTDKVPRPVDYYSLHQPRGRLCSLVQFRRNSGKWPDLGPTLRGVGYLHEFSGDGRQ